MEDFPKHVWRIESQFTWQTKFFLAIDDTHLVVNHRTDVGNCTITGCRDTLGCNCRSQAFSNDSGEIVQYMR